MARDLVPFCRELAQWAFDVSSCDSAMLAKLTVSDRMLGVLFQVYLGFCRGVRRDALAAFTHDIVRCFRDATLVSLQGRPQQFSCED